MNPLLINIQNALQKRENENLLRKLYIDEDGIDFISNDYLGFSKLIHVENNDVSNSPSGSRLLGGNNRAIEELEEFIANYHGFDSALFFNSGYAANLGFFSCILTRHDTFIYDELIHASIRDGIRLSLANSFSFTHNSLQDLEEKLKHSKGNVIVVCESIYSMDGDEAPLKEISELCLRYNAFLVVDEAHSIGVKGKDGKGMVSELNLQSKVFAVIYTYGKAMGSHGGAIAGHFDLKQYLINFSRPFIYTTAPSYHQVESVKLAYSLLTSPLYEKQRLSLRKNILFFKETLEKEFPEMEILPSHINKLILGGTERTIRAATELRTKGYNCRPVLSPTVPTGTERIRINLHSFNKLEDISGLIQSFKFIINHV